ncbi:MAG: hypothetical protein LDL56_00840 [Armatimonadetes bacterium]|jgi:hypothetical protein|nr:hypothetical protein [Armatimonadota bacterium]MCA1995756.1 hypothetical protein [Armatimonadota bacterium]
MKRMVWFVAAMILLGAIGCSGGSDDKAGSPVKEGDYAAEPGNAGQTR